MNNDIDEIDKNVYISNWFTSNNEKIISENNIKAVITLEMREKPDEIINFYKKNNINFIQLYVNDSSSENLQKYFDYTYYFIDYYTSRNENILVHCYAGISRSSSIILNYMLKKKYIENNMCEYHPEFLLFYILKEVRKIRNIINPNPGFINQIIKHATNYCK